MDDAESDFDGFARGTDLPAGLLKMLGDAKRFDEREFEILDDLAGILNDYSVTFLEKDKRPRELIGRAAEIQAEALKLAERIEELRDELDDIFLAALSTRHSATSVGTAMLIGENSTFPAALKNYSKFMGKLKEQIGAAFGSDRGGRAGVVAKIAGNSKYRFVIEMARVWFEFRGLPKATVDGEFHRFVCMAYRFATEEEPGNFDREVKEGAVRFSERVKLSGEAEKRIELLWREERSFQQSAAEAARRGDDDKHREFASKATGKSERRRRLIWWRSRRCFVF